MPAQTPPHNALFLILPSWLIERNVHTQYPQIQRFIANHFRGIQITVCNIRHPARRDPKVKSWLWYS